MLKIHIDFNHPVDRVIQIKTQQFLTNTQDLNSVNGYGFYYAEINVSHKELAVNAEH